MQGSLVCPECHTPLAPELLCPACGDVVGTYVEGMPCFSSPDRYWGEIPREEMERLNHSAQASGWRSAVEDLIRSETLRQYILSPVRADFQYLWDLPSDAVVLDLGAGLGAVTCALAGRCEKVVAVEGICSRARFLQTRATQSRCENVQVICADLLRLPLGPGQFDAIVMNGVLEWAGLFSEEDPRDAQLKLLATIRSLLKPAGVVFIGIENRVGVARLRGGIDHSGLAFTSLMPRGLADLVCRLRRPQYRSAASHGYRTYTYSLRGYRKLFREAGFIRIRAYDAWRGYNMPSTLLPLDNPRALAWFVSDLCCGERWLKRAAFRLAARARLWPHLASEYLFQLEKQ